MSDLFKSLFIPIESLPGLYKLPPVCLPPVFNPEDALEPTFGGVFQLLSIAAAYGTILYKASDLIVEGSELLLLIPEIAPVVGSVVLPVLGVIPDGAMVLYSGLGDAKKAQHQVSVGVGTLAGSTIMLLTISYFISVFAGAVDIIEYGGSKRCNYVNHMKDPSWSKLSNRSWSNMFKKSGVEPNHKALAVSAKTMLITCIPYLIIQGAAFSYLKDTEEAAVLHEKNFALIGFIVCVILFFSYLMAQIERKDSDTVLANVIDRKRERALMSGLLSLKGAFFNALSEDDCLDNERRLLPNNENKRARFEATVRKFFSQYDLDSSLAPTIFLNCHHC